MDKIERIRRGLGALNRGEEEQALDALARLR